MAFASLQDAVLEAINQDRARNGVGALSGSAQLSALASAWSRQVANTGSLSHQDPGLILGSPGYDEYRAFGENVLVGSASLTAAQIEGTWMSSPEHRSNILFPTFNIAGVGCVIGPDRRLWVVVDFGGA